MEIDVSEFEKPCPCGIRHHIAVRDILLEAGALEQLPTLFQKEPYSRWGKAVILCDTNTYEAAGRRVSALLPAADTVVLPCEGLHANERGVALAEESIPSGCGCLLAVGSGTIHDITRFIAHRRELPFLSIPTAASVDGFVSTVAAMTWGGVKRTFPAVSPVAVIADSAVVARAPNRLTVSGVGDMLGKFTALADWKIARIVTGEPLCEKVCALEEQALNAVCEQLEEIRDGGVEACEHLMYGLLLSGLAMQMVGNSRPASGAEHHCSHLWEMEWVSPHTQALHGEKVGVGLLLTARAYHEAAEFLRSGHFTVPPYEGLERDLIRRSVPPEALDAIWAENTPDPLAAIPGELLLSKSATIADVLQSLPSEQELYRMLEVVGAKRSLNDLGLPESVREITLRLSPYIRNRLTFMRLLKRFHWK